MKYHTTKEAAKILGLTDRQVRRYCKQGKLGERIGRNWAITDAHIAAFLGDVTHWGKVIVEEGQTLDIFPGEVYRRLIIRGGVVRNHGATIKTLVIESGTMDLQGGGATITTIT